MRGTFYYAPVLQPGGREVFYETVNPYERVRPDGRDRLCCPCGQQDDRGGL